MHSLLSSILLFKLFLSKYDAKFQPLGSYNLGSFMRVSTVVARESSSRESSAIYLGHVKIM